MLRKGQDKIVTFISKRNLILKRIRINIMKFEETVKARSILFLPNEERNNK